MQIRSTRRQVVSPQPDIKSDTVDSPSAKKKPNWRSVTINEAAVEIPQGILELSKLDSRSPAAFQGAQIAISGLALARAVQCFKKPPTAELLLEGTSSAALSAAGIATLFPTASAGLWSRGLLSVHGTTELALGVKGLAEELKKDSPEKLALASGVLDIVKGATTFLPLVFPATSDAVNLLHIGTLVSKTAIESHLRRS